MFSFSFQESVIGRRFIFYTLIFSSFIAVLFTVIQVQRESVREEEKFVNFTKIIEHSLLDSLGNSIWAYDDAQIYSQLQGINNFSAVQKVHLTLNDNVQFSVGSVTADYISTDRFKIYYANHGMTQYMGELTVYSSVDERYAYLLEYAGMILATNLSKTLFVVIFMFFLFDQLISKHLIHISKKLTLHNKGKKPVRIELQRKPQDGSKDELDRVVDAINNLQQRVFIERSKVNKEIQEQKKLHQKILIQKEQLVELERNIGLNEFALGLRVEVRKPLFKLRSTCKQVHHDVNTLPYDRMTVNVGIAAMAESIERALEVVERSNDLFKYKQPDCQPHDVTVSITKVLDLLSHSFLTSHIDIKHQTKRHKVYALVDRKHIEQVLLSVVKNALESLLETQRDNKVIELSAFTNDDLVEIHIEDNGHGIEEHLFDKVFVPYYSSKEKALGIGLSISRNLLAEMNGTIEIRNSAGGVNVVITLPASTILT